MDVFDFIDNEKIKQLKEKNIIVNKENNNTDIKSSVKKDNVKSNTYFLENEIKNNPFYFFLILILSIYYTNER